MGVSGDSRLWFHSLLSESHNFTYTIFFQTVTLRGEDA